MIALFHFGVILSAALGFSLQLIMARVLLPETGGLPIVWIACTFFFQTIVIFSYLYGQLLTRLRQVHQFLIHGSLFVLAASIFIPLQHLGGEGLWDRGPVLGVLTALSIAASLPFLLLSSHTVIFAQWLRGSYPKSNPYRLFASANAGSLAALLLYPFVFEPLADLPGQMFWWDFGFFGVGVLLVLFGSTLLLTPTFKKPVSLAGLPRQTYNGKDILHVLCAAALSCIVFLSATSYFSIVLFPVSLLWILPFGVYLVAWIIAFAGPPKPSHQQRILNILPFVFLNLLPMPSALLIALNTVLVGVVCLALHTRIAEVQLKFSQPAIYYVVISLGGILGNVLIIFLTYITNPAYVYPLAIFAATLAIPITTLLPWTKKRTPKNIQFWLPVAVSVMISIYLTIDVASDESGRGVWGKTDLFGAVRVTENQATNTRMLLLNNVIQGQENTLSPNYGYYGWLRELRTYLFPQEQSVEWAGLGMGVGTMAATAQAGDSIDFFEINPATVYAAQRYFSYLKSSSAQVSIQIGDGRKLLAQSSRKYDIIVCDAYAGGSIPQHMMTREFFQLCADRLTPDGIIAVHVSHRALKQLGGVVMSMGESLGFSPWLLEVDAGQQSLGAIWVLLIRPSSLPDYGGKLRRIGSEPKSGNGIIWTDQFSPVWKAW